MNNNRLVWISGITATAIYLICTTVAFLQYPPGYSPLTNWLSGLGNPIDNPRGAFVYNLGCILVGLSLLVFSLGLEMWNDGNKRRRIILTITQVTSIISALCLIVTALFPLGSHTSMHTLAAKLHIFFAGFFLAFSATILLRHAQTPKWFAYFGFLTALVNFVYGAFLYSMFVAEWAAIGLFIVYIGLISANSLKISLAHIAGGAMQG